MSRVKDKLVLPETMNAEQTANGLREQRVDCARAAATQDHKI